MAFETITQLYGMHSTSWNWSGKNHLMLSVGPSEPYVQRLTN